MPIFELMIFPEEFIKRLDNQKYIDSELLLKSLKEPSPVSIRVNQGKWNKLPAGSEPVAWCKTGFYLQSRPSFTLDPLFHSGCYYPREASGMFLEQVFTQHIANSENLRVLDLCAAPGGKSTQISDMIGKGSFLIANEVIRSRSVVLAETVTKWGKGNTIVTQNDPVAFGKFGGYFDLIFIDAPCSGEGMFRDRTAINEWTPENVRLCEERQKRILSDVWPALKKDGLLIYSTCTFNPGENEENIVWLLENRKAYCLPLDISNFDGIEEIDHNGVFGYGFYPGKIKGDGFFISVIRKTEEQNEIRTTGRVRNEYLPGKDDLAIAARWTSSSDPDLLKRGDELVILACRAEEYIHLFGKLNIVRGGTTIGAKVKDDHLPSHELALSQQILKNAFPSMELTYADALAYLRKDVISPAGLQIGWNLATFKGVNLGFVKNIGKRVNNYFPVGWRIRMDIPDRGSENIIRWKDEL